MEEEEEMDSENQLTCFRCDGNKVNKSGYPCRKCNGSGKINSSFYKEMLKMLREDVKSYTTQTFQRLMVDYLGKKSQE